MTNHPIGILGGLGPETTAEFYLRLVQLGTHTVRPPICIWSLPLNVRKEGEYIRHGSHTDYYLSLMSRGAIALQQAGSKFVVIPCNTVHEFHLHLSQAVNIPVLNLIEIVSQAVVKRRWRKVLLLATSRTISTQLYQRALEQYGVSAAVPGKKDQLRLDRLIQGLLGNRTNPDHQWFLERLVNRVGCDHIVLGCTDLQLVFAQDTNCIDSMETLARHTASLV